MVNMELYEFRSLLIEAATMGAAIAERYRKPRADVIRKREAEDYMVSQGFTRGKLDELEDCGMVKFHRLSGAKNSPRVCSRVELMAAVWALNKKTITF